MHCRDNWLISNELCNNEKMRVEMKCYTEHEEKEADEMGNGELRGNIKMEKGVRFKNRNSAVFLQ